MSSGLLSSLTLSLTNSLPILFEGNSDLTDATNVRRAPYKDAHRHFTIFLQICHWNIMLQVMLTKHFRKQNTCYTDLTPVIGVPVIRHCFLMLCLLLFTLLSS